MSSPLSAALQSVSTHRDVVPLYYVRSANRFIVTGTAGSNGGAVIVDDETGQIVRACASKRDALRSIAA